MSREAASIGLAHRGAERSEPAAPGRFYRPELDVVRFVAFALVFLHHSLPLGPSAGTAALSKALAQVLYACGWASGFGLSLFFTLSAYLICELLLREREATGAVLAKQFYIRRILRIWPLYFAALGIALIYALLPGGDPAAIAWVGWSAILLGNWYVVIHGFYPVSPMTPLWSISVEEQFYLFAPWAIKLLNRRSLSNLCIVLIVFTNLCLYHLGNLRVPDTSIWTNSFVQFENFAAGMLLCIVLHGKSPNTSMWLRLTLLAVAGSCWYFAVYECNTRYQGVAGPGSWPLIGGYGLVAIGCCAVLLAFLGIDQGLLPNWAIYLGRISYGLYVFHELAFKIVVSIFSHHNSTFGGAMMLFKGAASIGLTFLLASASYRYFETPFLRMKKRHEVILSRPV